MGCLSLLCCCCCCFCCCFAYFYLCIDWWRLCIVSGRLWQHLKQTPYCSVMSPSLPISATVFPIFFYLHICHTTRMVGLTGNRSTEHTLNTHYYTHGINQWMKLVIHLHCLHLIQPLPVPVRLLCPKPVWPSSSWTYMPWISLKPLAQGRHLQLLWLSPCWIYE